MKNKRIINFPASNYRISCNGKRLFYCCKCKQVSKIENGNICPNCGNDADVEWISSRNIYSISTLRTATVFFNEDKVVISLFFIHPWINTKVEKIAFKHSSQRIVFNTRTGQTYEMPQKSGNKKVIPVNRSLANVTYRSFLSIPYDVIHNEELCAAVQSAVAPHIEEQLNLVELKLANRLPQLNYKQVKAITTENSIFYNSSTSKVFRKTCKQQEAAEFIARVCKNLDIENNKTNRKLMLDGNFNTIKLAMDLGLRDVNNIRTVVKSINSMMYSEKLNGNYNNYMFSLTSESMLALMNDIVRLKGELVATKMLTDATRIKLDDNYYPFDVPMDAYYFCDVSILYNIAIVWEQVKGLVDDDKKKKYLKGSLECINSKLIKDLEKFKQKDVHEPFEYTDVEKEFEYNTGKYSFRLAKNKAEMIECGTDMHICVGQKSYTNYAAIKQKFIIFVRERGKFKACIELDNKYRLMQVKAFANGYAKDDLAAAVVEWAELHPEIEAEKCHDYMHMGKTVNYAQVDVDEAAEQQRRVQAALEAFD